MIATFAAEHIVLVLVLALVIEDRIVEDEDENEDEMETLSTAVGARTILRNPMERVTGIGGVFFRAKDPEALSKWYNDHLGVDPVPTEYNQPCWTQEAGSTAFAPFPQDTDHFGRAEQQWMLNFRVRDLDAMVEQLRAAKIEVTVDPEKYPNGRFARLYDPEGNPIEIWEPK